MNNKTKRLIVIGIIILISLIWFIYESIPYTEIIKDTDKYNEVISRSEHRSALTLFPDDINNKDVRNFYYQYHEGILFDSAQLILECYYTEEDYLKEKERISKEKNEWHEGGGEAKLDKTNFKYDAYVTMLGDGLISEYALLDKDNNHIIYIYINGIENKDIEFNKDYLPLGYDDGKCLESYIM